VRRVITTSLIFFTTSLIFFAFIARSSLAASAAPALKANAPQAVAAYIAAIRYFNAEIDQAEATQIVDAILRDSYDAGIDPRLVVAIVATESSFDRTARSGAGALGLGQLMPYTASLDGVSDPTDVDQNIRGTVETLRGNLEHYAGLDAQQRYVDAIAAYNAGTGAVDRYGGVPPYDETVRYVWKVVVLWRRLVGLSAT